MAQNYTRQSSFNDGDTISASLFNDEYNQLVNSFSYSSSSESGTGHRHDGSAGQGGNIYRIGDLDFFNKIEADSANNRWGFWVEVGGSAVEQVRIQDGAVLPVTTNDIDLGSGSLEFKDLHLSGTANIPTADINGGNIDGTVIGAATPAAGSFTTGSFSGNVTFADNAKAIFGAGSDLQIYHDGSHSYVSDQGTGSLYLQGQGNIELQNSAGTETFALFVNNGKSELYYDNAAKLATTSTGIDVTGTVTADGLTVDGGGSNVTVSFAPSSTFSTTVDFTNASSAFQIVSFGSGSASADNFRIRDAGASRLNIAGNGDISFYEDTGTTPKFFWDASAESLGIGTTSPIAELQVGDYTGNQQIAIASGTAGNSDILFGDGATGNLSYRGVVRYNHVDDSMQLWTSSTEAMRIDSSGRLLINKTSATGSLSLESQAPTGFSVGSGFYSASTQSTIEFKDSNTTANYKVRIGSETDALVMFSGGSESARLDASGNVGIGTSSPTFANGSGLEIERASATSTIRLQRTGTSPSSMEIRSGANNGEINVTSNSPLLFATNNSEAMRIDSSGNLLVGVTTNSSSVAGVTAGNGGLITACRSANYSGIFNRLSTDGDIVQFRKNGTTVGSIGARNGKPVFTQDSGDGLRLGGGAMHPVDSSNPDGSDGTYDIGASAFRFKDLYLSGGVYLGGTGAANLLDDYEEGTFTLSSPSSGYTISSHDARYTKIGRQVTLHFRVTFSAVPASNSSCTFTGVVPFTPSAFTDLHYPALGRDATTTGAQYCGQVISGNTNLIINSQSGISAGSSRTFTTGENYVFCVTFMV